MLLALDAQYVDCEGESTTAATGRAAAISFEHIDDSEPAREQVLKTAGRGSRRALFITSAGIPVDEAAWAVIAMHGEGRLPIMLKRADRLARG